MIGYKIAVVFDREAGPFPVVVTLEIPEDAKVVRPKDGILCNTRCLFYARKFQIKKKNKFLTKYTLI